MSKTIVSTVAAVLLVAASLPADAGGRHGGGGHSHARVGVYIGAPFFYGSWWAGPRPYYYSPYYYAPAPVVVVREPLVFYDDRGNPVPSAQVQAQAPTQAPQSPQTGTSAPVWFYCTDSQTYYPYAQTCASTWQRVIPHPPPQ